MREKTNTAVPTREQLHSIASTAASSSAAHAHSFRSSARSSISSRIASAMSDIRSMGLVVEQQVDPLIGHPGARVLSYAVMGVDFRIWRMR